MPRHPANSFACKPQALSSRSSPAARTHPNLMAWPVKWMRPSREKTGAFVALWRPIAGVSSLQRHILISLSIRDIHKAADSGFSKSQPPACWQSISASRAFPDAVGPPAALLADRSCAVEPDPPRSIPLWQDLPPPKNALAINAVLKDGLPCVTSAHEVVDRSAIVQTDFARHLFIGPEFQDASIQVIFSRGMPFS